MFSPRFVPGFHSGYCGLAIILCWLRRFGVTTGVGASINTAQITPGSSVVVFGCGGVGISAIQGARIAGAAEILAVDTLEGKLEQAKHFGATSVTTPDGFDEAKAKLTGGDGFDYAAYAAERWERYQHERREADASEGKA